MKISLLLPILFLMLNSCNSKEVEELEDTINFTDNFTFNLNQYWTDASQNNSPMSYQLENNYLKITTRALTPDRVKVKTVKSHFGLGVYKWRVYAPAFELNAQCSIGAFIYKNDLTEIDFEIGSGTSQLRDELNAQADDLVIYCTSQGQPFSSSQFLLKSEQWHQLKLKLSVGDNNNYKIEWFLNNTLLKTLQTAIPITNLFGIYNSLENLGFIGNQLPTSENYTYFDSFSFEGND